MNILEMSIAASVLIVAIVIIRAVGLYRLPKKMFLCLWGIATLRLLVPFSIPLPFSVPVEWATLVNNLTATPREYTIAIPDRPEATISITLIVWLAGFCVCAVFFSVAYFKSRKEFKTSLPVESEFIDRWLKDHPLRRSIQVRQTDRTKAPLTYGIFHPVILLPKRIDLTDETSLRYILAHEYVHIRHFDALTKLVLTVAVCCHWFNPLVWVMYILANRDIELICDETVVKSYEPEGKSAYALTLIKLEEIKSRVAIVSYFSRNLVEERVTTIMKTRRYTLSATILAFIFVLGSTISFATFADNQLYRKDLDHIGTNEDNTFSIDIISVNQNDEARYTSEEWNDILADAEKGDVVLFTTHEDEMEYNQHNDSFADKNGAALGKKDAGTTNND